MYFSQLYSWDTLWGDYETLGQTMFVVQVFACTSAFDPDYICKYPKEVSSGSS